MGELPPGWRRTPLPDVVDYQEGPGIMARDFQESGVPLIRLAGLSGRGSVLRGCNYLDPDLVERRWSHFKLSEGDTLLSTSASLGRVARVGREASGSVAYTGIIRMRPRDQRIMSRFIRYLLLSSDFQQQAAAMGAGSVMQHFGPSHLRSMSVVLPPPAEQEAIAALSSSLDEKFDSNANVAATAEELLATRAEASESGGLVPLGALVHCDREMIEPTKLGNELIDHYSIPAFDAARVADRCRAETVMSGKFVLKGPSILVSRLNPRVPRIWYAVPSDRPALCSTEFLVMRPQPTLSLGDIWLACSDPYFFAELAQRATGTSGSHQRIRPQDALSIEVLDPRQVDPAVRAEADLLLRLAHQRRQESRTLAELRDTLLPELLSGRLRVPAAEEMVESVT